MTRLAMIRHGSTDWNRQGLVQGRTDIPLSDEGVAEVESWVLPDDVAGFEWIASPLRRAAETARILFGEVVPTDQRLAEMDWGEWEGKTLADLRAELGDLMAAWEAKGLDFHGPGGESPRDVQQRTAPLLAEIAKSGRPTVAVTHRGVIRAIYARAIGWDMVDKAPEKVRDGCIHFFSLDADGRPEVEAMNVKLTDDE